MHGPLKDAYQLRTNFKDVAEQVIQMSVLVLQLNWSWFRFYEWIHGAMLHHLYVSKSTYMTSSWKTKKCLETITTSSKIRIHQSLNTREKWLYMVTVVKGAESSKSGRSEPWKQTTQHSKAFERVYQPSWSDSLRNMMISFLKSMGKRCHSNYSSQMKR